ncbi:N-acetylmuramoyl-L-alanine amidase [Clostridioides difficile]|uniref:N-acetylmuramoyl-L-alanine amidase n=1 Tax=Clostridioides difficile TaxID=1496 RepID=UPI000872BA89|nr:N-acetylmuramoyl-L-alanine amidase [Clostridioides difficile]AXU65014.1 phage-related cell wall hydrolase [Clostridioides difficile]EGT4037422.1 N-acetylmuramoyl-L-alanine amidase [Clostridioides difficile]EGT5089917.1 N-acetylmuramoyl-L-alanine amidase [Clostridioides difficile]EGT5494237.1 N-acetylmuramoyl-L-alanine amidase [Clostridioides difficile]EJX3383015.1 N-acetylmuramoyl-L-alanine amidase [Clostridioides difficile]
MKIAILTDLIVKWLKQGGATVYTGKVDKSNNYLAEQCQIANRQNVDVAIQIHFNADHTTLDKMGTETIYKTNNGKVYADRVNTKLATVFKNRGAKSDVRGLFWLSHTKAPAILIEVCFVDSKADTDYYIRHKDIVAKLIAEGILNKSINSNSTESGGNNNMDKFDTAIVYSGETDKAIATIMSFYISNSTIVDIKDYKSYMCRNVFVIKGGATEGIKKYPDKYTNFMGADRKETFKLVLEYLKNKKLL